MNPSSSEDRRRLRILLAEDNAVNQMLVCALLQRRGHDVVLAATGRDVLLILERQRFDAILMDVQMPELDGFQATRAIRADEAAGKCFSNADAPRVTIIAMTGQASDEDRRECLENGMDDHIAKPIQPDALYRIIESTVDARRADSDSSKTEPLINRSALESVVGSKPERFHKLVGVFLAESAKLMTELEAALAASDAGRLRRAAHSLKGAVAIFGAAAATASAQRVEALGETKNFTEAPAALQSLRNELVRLTQALTAARVVS